MTDEDLKKANEIKKQIREIDCFLATAKRVWTGKLAIKKPRSRLFFIAKGYGAFKSEEFELDTRLKNKVVEVLEEELIELKKELDAI